VWNLSDPKGKFPVFAFITNNTVFFGGGIVFVLFSSIKFKMVPMRLEKPICAPSRLSEVFLNVAFETVPMFV